MIITSIILSSIALAISVLMGQRNPVRSSGLTAGMLVLLVFSPLLLFLPKIYLSLPWISSDVASTQSIQAQDVGVIAVVMSLMIILYSVGCVFFTVKLGSHFLAIKKVCGVAEEDVCLRHLEFLKKCAVQLRCDQRPALMYSHRVDSPVITGLLKPMLLLPNHARNWSDETLEMVMLHELGHLKRNDLWLNFFAQFACAIHWCNPLVWMLRKRFTHECEYACDAHVISAGAHPKNYIHALCDVAEACHDARAIRLEKYHGGGHSRFAFSAALSMANKATLKKRVENLLDKKSTEGKASSFIVAGMLIISAGAALAINLIRPERQGLEAEQRIVPAKSIFQQANQPDQKEVKLRLSANPFPGDD